MSKALVVVFAALQPIYSANQIPGRQVRLKSCRSVGVRALPDVSKSKPGPLAQQADGNLRWNLGKYPYRECDGAEGGSAPALLQVRPAIAVLTYVLEPNNPLELRPWANQVQQFNATCAVVVSEVATGSVVRSLGCFAYQFSVSGERSDANMMMRDKSLKNRLQAYLRNFMYAGLEVIKTGRSVIMHNPDMVFLPDGIRQIIGFVTKIENAKYADVILKYNGARNENFNEVNWHLFYIAGNSEAALGTLQCIFDLWDNGEVVGRNRVLELAMSRGSGERKTTPSPRVCVFPKKVMEKSVHRVHSKVLTSSTASNSRKEPDLLRAVMRQSMVGSANTHCKGWDAPKCSAIDYELSFANTRTATNRNVTVGRKCSSVFDYGVIEVDARRSSFRPPKCQGIPLRGIVLVSASPIPRALLKDQILPSMESCCRVSFEPIGTARLRRVANEVLSSYSKSKATSIQKALNHSYFFVRDTGDKLLQIWKSGKVGSDNNTEGDGFLMSSNGIFLETARSMIHVLRKSSSLPVTIVVPDQIQEKLPEGWFGVSGVTTAKLEVPPDALPSLAREYGFRLHKLPMLLKAPYATTFYVDSDIFVCGPEIVQKLISITKRMTNADIFCVREGVRRVDEVNYVHGGVLAFRPKSALSRSFVRSWLRLYLVVMQSKIEKYGSIYEQPALTLVSDSMQQVLGHDAVHFFDSGMLARSHLVGGVEPYRSHLKRYGYAAELVHFNPYKEWPLVEEMVVDAGCGQFERPRVLKNDIDVLF